MWLLPDPCAGRALGSGRVGLDFKAAFLSIARVEIDESSIRDTVYLFSFLQ